MIGVKNKSKVFVLLGKSVEILIFKLIEIKYVLKFNVTQQKIEIKYLTSKSVEGGERRIVKIRKKCRTHYNSK